VKAYTPQEAADILRIVGADTLSTMCRLTPAQRRQLWESGDGRCAVCRDELQWAAPKSDPAHLEIGHFPALSRMTPEQLSDYSQPDGWWQFVAPVCHGCNNADKLQTAVPSVLPRSASEPHLLTLLASSAILAWAQRKRQRMQQPQPQWQQQPDVLLPPPPFQPTHSWWRGNGNRVA